MIISNSSPTVDVFPEMLDIFLLLTAVTSTFGTVHPTQSPCSFPACST